MSEGGRPDFTFFVFDNWQRKIPYGDWVHSEESTLHWSGPRNRVEFLSQGVIEFHQGLENFIEGMLDKGFEGVVTRSPFSPYKFGRSTLNQQYLIKIKERERSEALVIGTIPLLRNWNCPELNALGLTERTSHKDGKVEDALLGALRCITPEGIEFKVGTGFSEEQRIRLWNDRDELIGLICSYEHSPYGQKDAPRNPSFIGFRHPEDL
jgi:DNA ligase-1